MLDKAGRRLRSTLTGQEFPFDWIPEFTEDGESLEVYIPGIEQARPRPGRYLFERFADFLPFVPMNPTLSLGEGNTPLLHANARLQEFTGITTLLLKDETQNPTWSFKDRGSLPCIWMAQEMGEQLTATISTGNMGHSIAAYAGRAGLRSLVFVPHFAPEQKVQSILMQGAEVIQVEAPDYAAMKSEILRLAEMHQIRIVSGNGPIRVEGYKLTAFEMYEQWDGQVPDFIVVPTSACGHVRGIWKGWNELKLAGLVDHLPRMVVVQAEHNSPLVTPMRSGSTKVVPFADFHTVAEAITSGNPAGGNEILYKAREHSWLGETASEEEILEAQRILAQNGHFVEPSSATSLHAVKKLRARGEISADSIVVIMLTGGGLKDMDALPHHALSPTRLQLPEIENFLCRH